MTSLMACGHRSPSNTSRRHVSCQIFCTLRPSSHTTRAPWKTQEHPAPCIALTAHNKNFSNDKFLLQLGLYSRPCPSSSDPSSVGLVLEVSCADPASSAMLRRARTARPTEGWVSGHPPMFADFSCVRGQVVGYGHLGDGNIHLNVAAPRERASEVQDTPCPSP